MNLFTVFVVALPIVFHIQAKFTELAVDTRVQVAFVTQLANRSGHVRIA